ECKEAFNHGIYVEEWNNNGGSIDILFAMKEKVGALADALKIFKDNDVNLFHIESRSSRRSENDYEFYVELGTETGNTHKAIEQLRSITQYMKICSRDHKNNAESVPWFPQKINDLDKFS
ncbi:Protein henna-like protein, partial [Leptotrombidium deliense]